MPARIPRGAPRPSAPPDTCGGADSRRRRQPCVNTPNAALLFALPGGHVWLYLCPDCQDRLCRQWRYLPLWPPAERLTIPQAAELAACPD